MKPKSSSLPTKSQPQLSSNKHQFIFTIAQLAISQICKSVGYKSTQISALETLTHVATLYIKSLAKEAASYANAARRTESNDFDIINALHDLASVEGFAGASSIYCGGRGNCVLRSNVVKDLSFFVDHVDLVPFARSIPRREENGEIVRLEVERRGVHIPDWLPRLPDESSLNKSELGCNEKVVVLWEKSDFVKGGCVSETSLSNAKRSGELRKERGRVRFKIGEVKKKKRMGVLEVEKKNGVCGVKKLCCWNGNGDSLGVKSQIPIVYKRIMVGESVVNVD